jgi:uncharacterized lipoprotein YajG
VGGQVSGAQQVAVRVVVRDMRRDRARVSVKKNGYGIEMAPIVSETDIAGFVRSNVALELARRGFTVGNVEQTGWSSTSTCGNTSTTSSSAS